MPRIFKIKGNEKTKILKINMGSVGPKGDPFRYEDFTEEQLESLRGPRGYQGETGSRGPQGPKGSDFKYEDFTAEQLENLRGPQGEPGQPGNDGYSPVRGIDYWTPSDIAEIQTYIDEKLGEIENGSY